MCLNDLRQEKEIRHFCFFLSVKYLIALSMQYCVFHVTSFRVVSGTYKQRKTNKLTTEVNYCKRKEKRKRREEKESPVYMCGKSTRLILFNKLLKLTFSSLFCFVCLRCVLFWLPVQSKNSPSVQIYSYSLPLWLTTKPLLRNATFS